MGHTHPQKTRPKISVKPMVMKLTKSLLINTLSVSAVRKLRPGKQINKQNQKNNLQHSPYSGHYGISLARITF